MFFNPPKTYKLCRNNKTNIFDLTKTKKLSCDNEIVTHYYDLEIFNLPKTKLLTR